MTDEELEAIEGAALNALPVKDKTAMCDSLGNLCIFHDIASPEAILKLITDLKQARKERDWLSYQLEEMNQNLCDFEDEIAIEYYYSIPFPTVLRSRDEWIKAAKEAIK